MSAHKGCVKTGGRLKGSLNKVTKDIKDLARLQGPYVVTRLIALSKDASGAVAVAACRELLDRGYGKSPQPHDGDGQGGPMVVMVTTGVPRAS